MGRRSALNSQKVAPLFALLSWIDTTKTISTQLNWLALA